MAAEEIFGEFWFWILALAFWARSALGLLGAPRSLIVDALRRPAAAETLLRVAQWRLGPTGPIKPQLRSFRQIALLAFVAYAASGALFGDALGAAMLAAVGPIAGVSLWLEPRIISSAAKAQAALDAALDGPPSADGSAGARATALRQFADEIEQLWRLRLASTAIAGLATVAAVGIFV